MFFLYCKILQKTKTATCIQSGYFNILRHMFCCILSTKKVFLLIKCSDLRVGLDSQKQGVFIVSSFLDFVCSSQNTVAYSGEDYCSVCCSVKI